MLEQGGLFADLLPEPEAVRGLVAEVVLDLPLDKPFSYLVPDHLAPLIRPGLRVRVSVGNREVTGFVLSAAERSSPVPLKPLEAALEAHPALTPATLELGLWMACHYGASPGETLAALVPAAVRRETRARTEQQLSIADARRVNEYLQEHADKQSSAARVRVLRRLIQSTEPLGLSTLLQESGVSKSPVDTLLRAGLLQSQQVELGEEGVSRTPKQRSQPHELNAEQHEALLEMLPALESKQSRRFLLHGVTGSGKTEIYLRLLERTLALGKGAILLIPEISLTPQTVERLQGRLDGVAVLHSHLTDTERSHEWRRLARGEARVAVGPRSALFAPVARLGLIIMDEEHETTFKQQQSPRYHARDAAIERARIEGAMLLLGSATPSLEAESMARTGRIQRLSLPHRVLRRPLPTVHVVDMRSEACVGPGGIFSRRLVVAMERTLAQKEQVLLFLNRRGFSTTVVCRTCDWKATCRNCAIQLTHYREDARLLCHHCGHESPAPRACPECHQPTLRFRGFGTERVAAAAAMLFPKARILRRDGDALRTRGAPEQLYNDMKDGKVDILIGTQVLAKGFDIPAITLVGVISADTALLIPEFRSAERTYQLLAQVAGRAGRGQQPGRVLVQTNMPEHFAITAAAKHDHDGFVRRELDARRAAGYPPHGHLLRAVVSAADEALATDEARRLAADIRSQDVFIRSGMELLGPAPCPLAVLQGEHRVHLLLRSQESETLTRLLPAIRRKGARGTKILLDRDPVNLL
jgi:primosomal protein N' (replication factor Y)